ncbi:MAG: hypothetical protein IKP40_08440 [Clostridia bacterium]|nr:hypothetical protein [Clostridia bacterium]
MRLRAWLDGQPIDGLDGRITLTDIIEEAPRLRVESLPSLGGDGLRLARCTRDSLSVRLLAEVHERDPGARQGLLDSISAWCGGSVLKLSTRPGRLLEGVCTAYPGAGALGWTESVTIRFTAWAAPFWQAETPDRLALTGLTAGGKLCLRGTADTVLEAEITAEEAVSTLRIGCGADSLVMTGLGMSAGETLRLSHDGAGISRLTIGGPGGSRSALSCREAESADEIRLRPGVNLVTLAADGAVDAVMSGRGRWR